ncbi:MAG TPA: acetylxylan esterase [Candidatus Paceibacterota bacterium]|nr:acetylxylan esterase [Verrucomicrobiota bacterium]HRY46946.1 acetylxylan esterase [Candidatus Paceibacterota bacterium]HSA02825.1 acetylxylan esterase [Candidatus Paceibacterota bacterium]
MLKLLMTLALFDLAFVPMLNPAQARAAANPSQEPPDTNYDESKVPPYVLPDPLVCLDGRKVTDADLWRKTRRPEILRAFAEHVYGRTPEIQTRLRFEKIAVDSKVFGGLATRRQIRIRLLESDKAPWIDLLLYVPNKSGGPAPVFLGLNYGNQGVQPDPEIVESRNSLCQRGEHAHRWPLELLLKRGYAVASFHGGDLELDRHGSGCRFTTEAWEKGIRHFVMRQSGRTKLADDEWGSIGAWAWGLSRALDYLDANPNIDGHRVAVFGHSRTGKAALWAGAQDERFAITISNNSGQGGASLARRRYGETVAASYALSGSWYCKNYARYGNNESALPVDAHMLIALIAPRPVYVASAEQDRWADPRGEFLAARQAEPVYALLGRPGLGVANMPGVNEPVGQTLGYHVRSGDHEITAYDWERYLDFADRHLP